MTLNARSLKNLEGVHADLKAVVERAAEKAEFFVTEGVRTKERQLALVKAGKSQTKNSRHLYGLAIDLCDSDGCYDAPDMTQISRAMKSSAAELGIDIQWGGDWQTFKDTPHFELSRKTYPDTGAMKPFVIKPGTPTKAAIAATVATVVNQAAPLVPVPVVPDFVTQSVVNAESWKAIGGQIWTLKLFAFEQPVIAAALCISVVALWLWPRKA